MPIKSVKMQNFEKQNNAFLSHIPRITQPKNQIPWSKDVLCSPVTDRHTDRPTDTKVTTMGTLLGFQEFSFNLSSRIGPIIASSCHDNRTYYNVGPTLKAMSLHFCRCACGLIEIIILCVSKKKKLINSNLFFGRWAE